jgi:hypothetical protein
VWQNDSDDGRTAVDDKPRTGRPSTSTANDGVCRTCVRSRQDGNVKLTDMTREIYISAGTERSVVCDQVDYGEVCVRCVPKHLTSDEKACLSGLSVLHLTLYASHRELFVPCTFTGIKSG